MTYGENMVSFEMYFFEEVANLHCESDLEKIHTPYNKTLKGVFLLTDSVS